MFVSHRRSREAQRDFASKKFLCYVLLAPPTKWWRTTIYSQGRILAFQRLALSRELPSRIREILIGKKVRDGTQVIWHTVVHHSSTSTYMPDFTRIGDTFCGRTDGPTDRRTSRQVLLGGLFWWVWPNKRYGSSYENTVWSNKNGATLHFPEYLENDQRYLYDFLHTSRLVYTKYGYLYQI